MRRRTLLQSAVPTLALPLTGCSSESDESDESRRLGWLAILNFDTEPHIFDLRVERGGTTVHESSHTVEGKADNSVSGAVADCTWGETKGDYTVAVRLDGDEWSEQSLADDVERAEMDPDCAIAEVRYARYESEKFNFLLRADCSQVPDYDGGCTFANE